MLTTELVFTILTKLSEEEKKMRGGPGINVPNEIINDLTIISDDNRDKFLTQSKLILERAYNELNQLVKDCRIDKLVLSHSDTVH